MDCYSNSRYVKSADPHYSLLKWQSCKAVHQSLPGTRLTGLWCNNSLSFNLIFFVFFSSSFVCLFPWFWLLSFLRRYVHLLFPNASPSLSSQVLLVVRHAFVLFFVLIFFIYIYVHSGFFFFICRFFFLFLVSPLTHLNLRCLSVGSLIELVVCPHSFISVGGCWAVAGSFATPWTRLGELMLCDHSTEQFDPLFSVCCGGHSLWSGCFFVFFFWKLHYPFFPHSEHNKGLLLDSPNWSWTHLPIGFTVLFLVFFLLSGCMERGYCTFSTMWLCSPYLNAVNGSEG